MLQLRALARFRLPALAAMLALAFALSQLFGGEAWDEQMHRIGHDDHVRYAGEVLTGDTSRSFHDINRDLEYYGLITMGPASAIAAGTGNLLGLDESSERSLFRTLLHASAFAWALATVWLVYLIVKRETDRPEIATIAALLLLTYPTWLGHGFFNFKDLPQAFFYMLAFFGAREALQDRPGAFRKGLILLAIATVGAGTVRLAAIPLLIPQYLLLLWAILGDRDKTRVRLRESVLAGFAVLFCIYAFTPASWRDPIEYLQWNIAYMSQHGWSGCTLTMGACIQATSADWSTLSYLAQWFAVRLPLLVLLLTPLAAAMLVWRGNTFQRHVVLAGVLPLIVLSAMNSTLYDGIRHILFVVPCFILMIAFLADRLARKHPAAFRAFRIAAYASLALFVVDNLRLFPFNYVYFNEPARFFVSEETFDTDYWGYSLREAAGPLRDAADTASSETPVIYTAWPGHLVTPFAGENTQLVRKENIPSGSTYYEISLTRGAKSPAPACGDVQYVERRLSFAPRSMRLSYATICQQG
ncbi:MAG: hypothetical protein AAFW65_07460 [Pseudomonadota bacterium]